MNMFDMGLSSKLEAYKINTPMNAMLMDRALCQSFGKLQWYLQEVPVSVSPMIFSFFFPPSLSNFLLPPPSQGTINTYSFHTFPRYRLNIRLPFEHITFTNHEGTGPASDLPSPRLLRFHRLCCLILNMSGAAQYVEHLLCENARLLEQGVLSTDGRSNIDLVMSMNAYYKVFPFQNEYSIRDGNQAHGNNTSGNSQVIRTGGKRGGKRKKVGK